MLYRLGAFAILVFFSLTVFAQNSTIESLKAELEDNALSASQKIDIFNQLARLYLYSEPEKTEYYTQQAIPLTIQNEDDESRAVALRFLGMASMYQGKNDNAFGFLTQAISVAEITENFHLLSICYRALGVFYELTVDYDSAMKYYIEALKYAKLSDEPSDLAMVYNNLGNVLNSQGDFDEAANYFQKSIFIHRSIEDVEMEMNATVGLAVSYLKGSDTEKALQILTNVRAQQSVISDFTYSESTVNLAHVHNKLGHHQQAIELYKYVINDPRGGAYPQAIAAAYLGLAEVLAVMESYDQALSVYRDGINEIRGKTSVESEMALYEELAKLELKLGNYEAAAVVQAEYIERRNTIQPLTQNGIIQKLESQLKVERDVIKLQEALLQQERDSRHASVYLFASVVISLFCIVLILALRLRKHKLLSLQETNHALTVASQTDHLTGVGNRRYLDHKLSTKFGKSGDIAFLLLDIDHFKHINDSHGHDVGDEVLIALANQLTSLCNDDDFVARLGGEEFAILLLDTDTSEVLTFADKVRKTIEEMTFSEDCKITISIGVSSGNMKSATYDELYKQADLALYQAKRRGRNTVCGD